MGGFVRVYVVNHVCLLVVKFIFCDDLDSGKAVTVCLASLLVPFACLAVCPAK